MARLLALGLLAGLLVACGSSPPKPPPQGGPTLGFAIAAAPRTLDPARAADLVSLNVAHELYAGLTRFAGRGVEPDLAESWERSEGGLVWTFHLRKGLRWSDGKAITAADFRRSWLRALDPKTGSAYARAEMQNIRGARRYHATGSGAVDVEAVDDRTLRVTLQHPVPWLDQQVAYPVFFPVRSGGRAWSGPFRLDSQDENRLVLERNSRYWDAATVKPRRIVLKTTTRGVDGILPRGLAPPGFHWIETARPPPSGRRLSTLSVELLWFVTRGGALSDRDGREDVSTSIDREQLVRRLGGGARPLGSVVPPAMPGAGTINSGRRLSVVQVGPLELTLAYTTQDAYGATVALELRRQLAAHRITVSLRPVPTLSRLLRLAGPPAQPGIDMVLLGWSAEFSDAYNILDLFPCASALNIARWCDRSYDGLMRRAVRTLDNQDRYELEHRLVQKLDEAAPAAPLFAVSEHVELRRGVRGFRWSPVGFYELMGMTRS
jgi:oligopeptide transport system substrate-binding protein